MSQQVDNTAISQIRDMVLSQFIEEKLAGADCPAVVLPKDVSIETIERLHTERFRFRGKLDTGMKPGTIARARKNSWLLGREYKHVSPDGEPKPTSECMYNRKAVDAWIAAQKQPVW